ncbi:hypothetical protein [Sporosarcina sp. E16_8]|uniref:hypothetical protein n=1 Tax=Sporosarcina sp. E16_8 TaxID=2789295 RepID=UPI001A917FB4|nr:hypothetical protein [Sporosarcina sp. E16_8]MBO0586107.1 hypothetical protein [Sporosarcina sp. E16_8]
MSKFILVMDDVVEAIFDKREQGLGIEDQLIEVSVIPKLVRLEGKDFYYYWNDSEVEIRYTDKP